LKLIYNSIFDALRADQVLIKKFGEEYLAYLKKVSRLYFLAGLIILIKKKQ